jgi:anti-repressor protein
MEELIKIRETPSGKAVSARELYRFLGFDKSQWSRWYASNIINYDFFIENVDYQSFDIVSNGNPTKDFALSINMAKELSMLARTQKGKEARLYFIECEKQLKQFALPQTFSEALRLLADTKEREEKLQLQVSKLQPKADYLNHILASDSVIDIGQASKVLELPFGRNTLFKKLREKGILFKNRNEPKQEYVAKGWFLLKEMTYNDGEKDRINLKILVTQKGLAWISKLFNPPMSNKQLSEIN